MTAMKLTKIDLSELDHMSITCKRCGSGHSVTLENAEFNPVKCPSCSTPYGELAGEVFYRMKESFDAYKKASALVDIEFFVKVDD